MEPTRLPRRGAAHNRPVSALPGRDREHATTQLASYRIKHGSRTIAHGKLVITHHRITLRNMRESGRGYARDRAIAF